MPYREPDTNINRLLLLLCGGVYLLWWFAVELFLPQAFNPVGSRLAVVAFCLAPWALSFPIAPLRLRLDGWVGACVWVITLHYFYLFYGNHGDQNWVIGAFITLLATTHFLFSRFALLLYSVYVIALCLAAEAMLPALDNSLFLPGVITILLQANVSLFVRNRTLERLAESNDKFRQLFHATSEGVLLHEDGRVQEVNEALNRMLGYSGEELLGTEAIRLIHPDEQAAALERLRLADENAHELPGLRKDGTVIDLEVRAKNLTLKGKPVRLVTLRDLSDRRRAEAERLASHAMAERMAALDDFLALASHELKTPVTSIQLWMQMLEKESGQLDEQASGRFREISRLVLRQIKRLNSLIETMLNTSQLSSGRLKLELARVDLAEIVRTSIEALGAESERSRTPFRFTSPGPIFVSGDASRLAQIVDNLLTNGIKYGNGKPVDISLAREGSDAVLRVQDHGLGIPPEHLERIFERFERAAPAKSTSGLGLGLYLVSQLTEAHGGHVEVKSRPGEGSVFMVRFPAA